jgi:hypothetical protein
MVKNVVRPARNSVVNLALRISCGYGLSARVLQSHGVDIHDQIHQVESTFPRTNATLGH